LEADHQQEQDGGGHLEFVHLLELRGGGSQGGACGLGFLFMGYSEESQASMPNGVPAEGESWRRGRVLLRNDCLTEPTRSQEGGKR